MSVLVISIPPYSGSIELVLDFGPEPGCLIEAFWHFLYLEWYRKIQARRYFVPRSVSLRDYRKWTDIVGSWFATCTFYLEVVCNHLTSISVWHSDCQSGRLVGCHRSLCVGGRGSANTSMLYVCVSNFREWLSDSILWLFQIYSYLLQPLPWVRYEWESYTAVDKGLAVQGPKSWIYL